MHRRLFSRSDFNGLILIAGLAILTFGIAWTVAEIRSGPLLPDLHIGNDISATVLSEPMTVPSFNLVDHDGRPFSQGDLRGQWTFLFFGYTHCPDICPMTLSVLNLVDKLLREMQEKTEHPHFVFISVDSARDTPKHLAEYVSYFNPEFLGVTGSEEQLLALTKPLGIGFMNEPRDGQSENYVVNHSAAILLVDPEGQLRALTSPPHDAATIVRDYNKIITIVKEHG